MASNKVEFEIVANTKEAGKAVLELSRKVNNALKIKSDDKGVKALQTQLGKINKDLEKSFTDAKKLGLAFNQYDANASKIKKLSKALETMPKGSVEYKDANAQIEKLTNANKAMDEYAKSALNEIVKKYGEIKTTNENILGLKTEEAKKTSSTASNTKKEAEAQKQLEGSVKDTNSALEQEQLDAKKAEEQFEATEKARKSGKKQKIDEEPVSKTTVTDVKAKTQEVLSRGMGSTYAELDRYKKDLLEIKNLIQELGDGKPLQALDEEYQKISSELAKIRAEQSALNKESTTFGETVSEDTKPEIIEDVKAQAMEALSKSATDAANSMAELDRRLTELKDAKDTIKALGIPPELSTQYNQLSAEIDKVNIEKKKLKDAADLQTFRTAMQGVLDTTDRVERSMRMDDAKNNIAELIRRYEELKQVKATLEDYGLPREMDSRYNDTLRMMAQLNAQIRDYKKNLIEAGTESETTGSKGEQAANRIVRAFSGIRDAIGGAVSRIKDTFSNMGTGVGQVSDGFNKVQGAIDRVKSSFAQTAKESRRNFKHMLTNLTKYVFGFRSLFFLIRRLRKGLVEGIKNVVRYEKSIKALKDTKIDGIQYKSVNQSINQLRSSLLYLKNAWAAAFAPILTVVTPMLTALMNAVADAGNYIAQFVGALTGQKVVLNAAKVSAGDYSKGIDKVKDKEDDAAGSAKKLNDRLADFDDLHVLGKDDDNGGSGSGTGGGNNNNNTGTNPNNMFYFVPGENSLADMIKEAWEKADFTAVGELIKNKIMEMLGSIEWDKVTAFVVKLFKSLGTFLVGLFGDAKFWESIGDFFANAQNAFIEGFSAFLDTTENTDFGKALVSGLNKYFRTTNWSKMGLNVNRFATQIIKNLCSFFDNMDTDTIAKALSDYLSKVNLKDLALKVGKLTISVVSATVKVLSKFVVETGEKVGNKWLDDVLKGWQTYIDGKPLHVKTDIDPKDDPIGALAETWFLKFGELGYQITVGIGKIFGLTEAQSKNAIENVYNFLYKKGTNTEEQLRKKSEELEKQRQEKMAAAIKFNEDESLKSWYKSLDNSTVADKIKQYVSDATGNGVYDGIKSSMTDKQKINKYYDNVTKDIITPQMKEAADQLYINLATSASIKEVSKTFNGLATSTSTAIERAVESGVVNGAALGRDSLAESGIVEENMKKIQTRLTDTVINGYADGWKEIGKLHGAQEIAELEEKYKKLGAAIPAGLLAGAMAGMDNNPGNWTNTTLAGPIRDSFANAFGIASPSKVAYSWGEYIIEGLDNGITAKQSDFETTLDTIKTTLNTKFGEAKADAETKAGEIQTAFDTAFTNIKTNASTQLDAVKTKFIDTFNGIKEGIRSPINGIINLTESLVNKVIDGVNGLVKKLNDIPAVKFTNPETNKDYKFGFKIPTLTKVSIPKLAQGAVIPPNKAFMAMLGDQSHGTNIEAPLDTIKQAVAEVLANNGNAEVIRLLQQLIGVVESKNLVIGDKEIGRANARYTNQQRIIRGTSF